MLESFAKMMNAVVVLVAYVLLPIGESSFCSFDVVGKCGTQHNTSTGHGVLANVTVNFTGCQCSGDQFSSVLPVESTCLGDDKWSQDPPTCNPATPCILPDVNFTLHCYNPLGSSCQLPTDTNQVCVGDGIAGRCPIDGIYRQATCQCDGYWSVEICPPIACDTSVLEQCGSNLNYTTTVSYYGTVPPNTMATFNSKCDTGVVATSFCQENGQWLTQGTNMCSLPEVSGFPIFCNGGNCKHIGKSQFCEGETIGGTCPLDGVYRQPICQCDGYWSAEICPPLACDTVELEQCGSNFNFTSTLSYYGTVPPNTMATFDSKCNTGVVATSFCQENGQWLTQGVNMCSLPEANGITIFCDGGNCVSLGRTHFCEGEEITGTCNLDGIYRRATCQCDGNWSTEICRPPACDINELKQCGQKMEFSSTVSYYGTVTPCTIATFESFGNSCNDPIPVRSVCQPDGHWLTEGISTCTLPTSYDQSIIVHCLNPDTNTFDRCDVLRRSHFCEGEEVHWTCDGQYVTAFCQCNGTWSKQICLPKPPLPQSPVVCPDSSSHTSLTASTFSNANSATYFPPTAGNSAIRSSLPTPSTLGNPATNSTAATWISIAVGIGTLVVVCLLLGMLVAGGLLYYKKRQKVKLSSRSAKFTNTDSILAIPINPLIEESPLQRTFSEPNSYSCVQNEGDNTLITLSNKPEESCAYKQFKENTGFVSSEQRPNADSCQPSRDTVSSSSNYETYFQLRPDTHGDNHSIVIVNHSSTCDSDFQLRTSVPSSNNDESLPRIDLDVYNRSGVNASDVNVCEAHFQLRQYEPPAYLQPTDAISGSSAILKHDENALSEENESPYEKPPANEKEIFNLFERYKVVPISDTALTLKDHIGAGEFGDVFKGEWVGGDRETLEVAIKVVKPGLMEDEGRAALLQEAALLAQFKNDNIITLHGVCVYERLMVVTEMMHRGDLRGCLLSIRKMPDLITSEHLPQTLLSFCRHIAAGMSYLATKNFVHRDLAARNILVTSDLKCKIADFGLSRQLDEDHEIYWSSGGRIPVKWTAPEALVSRKYSSASDVWSFAITLFEIWSLGYKPYHSLSNTQTIEKVKGGYRLPPPPGCPREIYKLMMQCWNPEASKRPAFSSIVSDLNQADHILLKLSTGGVDSPEALTLMSPLQASQMLHADLQNLYSCK